jgi:hypothetical protein
VTEGLIGYPKVMTNESADRHREGVTDILTDEEVVHVPPAIEDLVDSHEMSSAYVPEVPDWEPKPGETGDPVTGPDAT